jgi:hypothetical protein
MEYLPNKPHIEHIQKPIVMPFGKYKGIDLYHIPFDYLQWILLNLNLAKYPFLKQRISEILSNL